MSPDFERLIGRAVADKEFRDALLADPEGTAKSGGFNLSNAELQQLKEGLERVQNAKSSADIDSMFEVAGSQWGG